MFAMCWLRSIPSLLCLLETSELKFISYHKILQYYLSESKFSTLVDLVVEEEKLPRSKVSTGVRCAMRNVRSRLSALTHTETTAIFEEVSALERS